MSDETCKRCGGHDHATGHHVPGDPHQDDVYKVCIRSLSERFADLATTVDDLAKNAMGRANADEAERRDIRASIERTASNIRAEMRGLETAPPQATALPVDQQVEDRLREITERRWREMREATAQGTGQVLAKGWRVGDGTTGCDDCGAPRSSAYKNLFVAPFKFVCSECAPAAGVFASPAQPAVPAQLCACGHGHHGDRPCEQGCDTSMCGEWTAAPAQSPREAAEVAVCELRAEDIRVHPDPMPDYKGVTLEHIPTGLRSTCIRYDSQHKNKATALTALRKLVADASNPAPVAPAAGDGAAQKRRRSFWVLMRCSHCDKEGRSNEMLPCPMHTQESVCGDCFARMTADAPDDESPAAAPSPPPTSEAPGESALSSDMSLLDEAESTHPAYPAFVREMTGRAYGEEALQTAWHWFKDGWIASSERTSKPSEARETVPIAHVDVRSAASRLLVDKLADPRCRDAYNLIQRYVEERRAAEQDALLDVEAGLEGRRALREEADKLRADLATAHADIARLREELATEQQAKKLLQNLLRRSQADLAAATTGESADGKDRT